MLRFHGPSAILMDNNIVKVLEIQKQVDEATHESGWSPYIYGPHERRDKFTQDLRHNDREEILSTKRNISSYQTSLHTFGEPSLS